MKIKAGTVEDLVDELRSVVTSFVHKNSPGLDKLGLYRKIVPVTYCGRRSKRLKGRSQAGKLED